MGLTKKLSTNYFKSKDIRVFPSSFRGTYTPSGSGEKVFDPESRLNTEANFIAPGRVGNNVSYIVSHTTSNIKFVVGGYYFELNNLSDYTDFLKGAELGIKLREITIANSTEDPSRKTLILDSWEEDTTNILDSTGTDDNNISFFLGLKKIVTGATATASIKLFNTDGTINQEAFPVELKHGTGTNSLMHGTGLIAGGSNQTVIGTYNNNVIDSDTNEIKNIFEIGVGTAADASSRKNAVEVSKTGNTTLNGTLTANGVTQLNNTLTVGTSNNNKATDLHGSLTVDGATQLNNTLTVGTTANNKKTTLYGELEVTGTSTLATTATINNTGVIIGSSDEGNTKTTTLYGTLTTNGATTLNDTLVVATDKTTTLGGELIVGTASTAAANKKATINGSLTVAGTTQLNDNLTVGAEGEDNSKDTILYGNLTTNGTTDLNGTTSIIGVVNINQGENVTAQNVNIKGNVSVTGKLTSTFTNYTEDDSTTLTTKSYVDSKYSAATTYTDTEIDNLALNTVGSDGSYIKTINQSSGKVNATTGTFESKLVSTTNNNAPTSKAVSDYVADEITQIWYTAKNKISALATSQQCLKDIILDVVYPRGSIYTMYSEDNLSSCPIQDTLGGTWELIETGRFLVSGTNARNNTYSAANKGGSADAVNVSHTHTISNGTIEIAEGGSHSHSTTLTATAHDASKDNCFRSANNGKSGKIDVTINMSGGEHTHTGTIKNLTLSTDGEAGTDKNLPPYLAVYMWKRTA